MDIAALPPPPDAPHSSDFPSRFLLFDTQKDISMNFEMHKWILIPNEADRLKAALKDVADVEVIGVYGCPAKAKEVVKLLLFVGEMIEEKRSESDQLVVYYKPQGKRMCVVYYSANSELFRKKPYLQSSRENVYLRLLLDLSSTIVCCPPQPFEVFSNPDQSLAHPFVPAKFRRREIRQETIEVSESVLVPLTIDFPGFKPDMQFVIGREHGKCVFLESMEKQDLRSTKASEQKALDEMIEGITEQIIRTGELLDHHWSEIITYQRYLSVVKVLYQNAEKAMLVIRTFTHCLSKDIQPNVFHPFLQDFVAIVRNRFEVDQVKLEDMRQELCLYLKTAKEFQLRSKHLLLSAVNGLLEEAELQNPDAHIAELDDLMETQQNLLQEKVREWLAGKMVELKAKILEALEGTQRPEISFKLSLQTIQIEIESERQIRFVPTSYLHSSTSSRMINKREVFMVDDNIALAMFSQTTGIQMMKFNPLSNSRYDVVSEELEEKIVLVPGSTVNLFVAYKPTQRNAFYGPISQGKMVTTGKPLFLYKDRSSHIHDRAEVISGVDTIIAACLLPENQLLYVIDENGRLYTMDLRDEDSARDLMLVTAPSISISETSFFPLTPSSERFCDIQSSKDESTIFLFAKVLIEIYNRSFVKLSTISTKPETIMKVISVEFWNYILLYTQQTGFTAYLFYGPNSYKRIFGDSNKKEIIPGNPVVDVWGYVARKYGLPASNQRKSLYFTADNPEDCLGLLEYSLLIDELKGLFMTQTLLQPAESPQVMAIPKDQLLFRIYTLQPIHICSIQEGNLVPLRRGISNLIEFRSAIISSSDFIQNFTEFMDLGHIESLLESYSDPIIVSIMGKQSSGKSYFMNQLFGSRFDVASSRCTDGIWMSVTVVNERIVVALDCEGLFSIERSEQEEMKMCLFISAISDVTIVNIDMGVSKHLTEFLQKFTTAASRLDGKKLFKGKLSFVLRDISEQSGALSNLQKTIDLMRAEGKASFIDKIFSGKVQKVPVHHFQKPEFLREISQLKKDYLTHSHWISGGDFLATMKFVLAQVYADDVLPLDFRMVAAKLKSIRERIVKRLQTGSDIRQYLADDPVIHAKIHKEAKYSKNFSFRVSDIRLNPSFALQPIKDLVGAQIGNVAVCVYHEEISPEIDTIAEQFFEQLEIQIINKFSSNLPEEGPNDPIMKENIKELERDLEVFRQRMKRCGRYCRKCDLTCWLSPQHEGEDDCKTDHLCHSECKQCRGVECGMKAGHQFEHLCNKKKHNCLEYCAQCSQDKLKQCVKALGHGDEHNCGQLHPCPERCAMAKYCQSPCKYDKSLPHKVHSCGYETCSAPCFFRDQGCRLNCSEPHLHELASSNAVHMCNRPHSCGKLCEHAGICNVSIRITKKPWGESGEIELVELSGSQNVCTVRIPAKEKQHQGRHICSTDKHRCKARCPDCDMYCMLEPNHSGLHKSDQHRNKTNCQFIHTKERFDFETELRSGKKSVMYLKVGENATPEYCHKSCERKGRGHFHPIECPGQGGCLTVRFKGMAVHGEKDYIGMNARVLDLVECRTYYNFHGWQPPIESLFGSIEQDKFRLCPFFCTEPHDRREYCDRFLFHSMSNERKKHGFACSHPRSDLFDICFILDCTGSMSWCFEKVKTVIGNVLHNCATADIRFAIVAYTDHEDPGLYPQSHPVAIYPPSKDFRDYSLDGITSFISTLKAGGGGGHLGEAVIDGLYEATQLKFRKGVQRIAYLIGDDTAHGQEFIPRGHDVLYPNGCPCGYKWKSLLSSLKINKTIFNVVKLSTIMNELCELFAREYGSDFKNISLDNVEKFTPTVSDSLVRVIDYCLELSIR